MVYYDLVANLGSYFLYAVEYIHASAIIVIQALYIVHIRQMDRHCAVNYLLYVFVCKVPLGSENALPAVTAREHSLVVFRHVFPFSVSILGS